MVPQVMSCSGFFDEMSYFQKSKRRRLLFGIVGLTVGLPLVLALVAISAWLVVPEKSVRLAISAAISLSKISEKKLKLSFGDVHYLEGGKGETIILLHGIYSRKESLLLAAHSLAAQYHVIVPDLPGFGANSKLEKTAYRLEEQQKKVLAFIDALDIQSFHVAGNSMGGLIGAMIAHDSPNRVSSLAFLGSPLGVAAVQDSEMSKMVATGKLPLVVENEQDFWTRFSWLEKEPSALNLLAGRGFVASEVASADLNKRIWREVSEAKPSLLSELAPSIGIPTLVIWCREDRVFHVSAAKPLLERFPRGHMYLLDGCGHAPLLHSRSSILRHYKWALHHIRNGAWPP